jgi:predicted DNA-binding protein
MEHPGRTRRYQETYTLRLSSALIQRARDAAEAREQRVAEFVRDAIRLHLARLEAENRDEEAA